MECAVKGLDPIAKKVDIDILCHANSLAYFYQQHAIYAYSLGEVDTAIVKAEKVLAKIKSKCIREIRQNELYQICRCNLFANARDFDETVALLEEYGYISRTLPEATLGGASGYKWHYANCNAIVLATLTTR